MECFGVSYLGITAQDFKAQSKFTGNFCCKNPIGVSPFFKTNCVRHALKVLLHVTWPFFTSQTHSRNTQKILQKFDTSFEIKMMVKIYAIEIIFRSHVPFQSYQLIAGLRGHSLTTWTG